ncbi:hypothetical protein V1478_001331, partial [Vespula squamosa]
MDKPKNRVLLGKECPNVRPHKLSSFFEHPGSIVGTLRRARTLKLEKKKKEGRKRGKEKKQKRSKKQSINISSSINLQANSFLRTLDVSIWTELLAENTSVVPDRGGFSTLLTSVEGEKITCERYSPYGGGRSSDILLVLNSNLRSRSQTEDISQFASERMESSKRIKLSYGYFHFHFSVGYVLRAVVTSSLRMKFCTAHQKGRRMPKGQSPVGRPSTFRGWRMDSKSQGTALWQRPKDNSSGTHSLINPSNSCSSLQDCIWLLGNSEDTLRRSQGCPPPPPPAPSPHSFRLRKHVDLWKKRIDFNRYQPNGIHRYKNVTN